MAYQYDEMGNVIGEFETEEERRRREEAASAIASKVEVKTYGDGSQTRTVTQETPAPVAGPVPFNPADYNRSIAAQESGANPNIGYHNQQLSSAYGPYGMTAGAWQDARRANPNLPADITQATPEQMTAGQTAFTGQNAKYLQNYGVPVNDNTLSAAHFLGAKGLSDYLQSGYISPQAAAANGGEENVRRIVDQRLGGNFAPASGAVQPQAPQAAAPQAQEAAAPVSPYSLATGQTGLGLQAPGGYSANTPEQTGVPMTTTSAINTYQSAQDDPKQLMALRYDENVPEFIRERAGQRAYELMDRDIKQAQAKQQATAMMTAAATGDRKAANDIAKTLTQSEGSWLKMLLLGFISPQLAGEEAIKLGFGNKWAPAQDAEGNQGLVEFNARGMPIRGVKADNTPMTEKELVTYATGGQGKVTTSGTFFQTPDGRILRAQSDENGRTRLVDAASGARYSGSTQGLTKLEEAGALRKMDRGLVVDLAKKHGQNVLDAEKEYVSINGPFKTPDERQQFRDAYGFGLAQPAPVPGVAGFPGGAAAPAGGAGLSQAQRAQQSLQGAQPQAAAPTGPVAPGAAPSAVTQPLAGMQTGVAINKKQQEEFVKYGAEDITPKADAGGQVSRIRKEQIKGPDGILNNPEIAGLLQGGRSGEVYNIIRDLATGNFKDQADLSARVESLGLTPRQKDVLYRQINLSTQVAPLTLKANAGAGSVSDAEQKSNRAANIDITRQPLYAGLADLSRSQFVNDMSVARADFKAANPQFQTTEQFNRAWSAEKAKRQKEYDQVFDARAQYIAKYGNTPGAVVDAFKYYPTPEWNSETGGWDLGTDFARKAARPKLSEFNR